MCHVTLDIPEDSLRALRLTPETAGREFLLMSAVKLFEVGRLSAGAAATLAGISKPEFLERLARLGVPAVNVTSEYLAGEARLG
jgi:predicted HTH domain antitoxin